ncbi:centromeric protein-C [Haematobia irritans]|uniref:centromeric protein-C n=1 Tax=Haematobia irritans TaxID=7368 RepID=UPI003F50C2B2
MAVKSKDSDSLELSNFFDNEDSDGYRLGQFLRKRHGCGQRQNFLFMNSDPIRLSLDVQLEKVAEKQNKNVIEKRVEEQVVSNVSVSPPKPSSNSGKGDGNKSLGENRNVSPRKSSIMRKRSGVSPGDNLRRLSLKRLTRLSVNHRRSLINDFENTISDCAFTPNVCSTPLSQENKGNKDPNPNESQPVLTITSRPNEQTPCTEHVDSFNKNVQNRDNSLQGMLGQILETTLKMSQNKAAGDSVSLPSSPIRRTYTLERGQKPGQVLLTPEPTSKTIENSTRRDQHIISNKTINRSASMSQRSRIPRRSVNDRAVLSQLGNVSMEISESMQSPLNSPNICILQKENGSAMNLTLTCNSEIGDDNRIAMPQSNIREMEISMAPNATLHNTTVPQCSNQSQFTIRLGSPSVSQSPLIDNFQKNKSYCTPTNENSRNVSYDNCVTVRTSELQNTCVVHSPQRSQFQSPGRSQLHVTNIKCRPIQELTLNSSHCHNQTLWTSRGTDRKRLLSSDDEIPNTQEGNISKGTVHNNENVLVPETQEINARVDNSIIIDSGTNVLVIPVNQTICNPIPTVSNKTSTSDTNSRGLGVSVGIPATISVENNQNQSAPTNSAYLEEADNLKLTDIITDDEEPPVTATSMQSEGNNSQAPLNLAASAKTVRNKRLRKRSIPRRRLQMEHSQIMSTETEAETLPINYQTSRKRSLRRNHLPMNKAPGTPLNGEKFAIELARMSNYEILDLRKRNSMGRIFPVNGRKSSRAKEEALKKQILLGDEIAQELIRRNMEPTERVDLAPPQSTGDIEIFPPVPEAFSDTTPASSENVREIFENENSFDRVSFRKSNTATNNKGARKNKVPDVLQHYLEIPEKIRRKQRKSLSFRSSNPRPLYTSRMYDSDDNQLNKTPKRDSVDKTNKQRKRDSTNKQNLPCVPSPPRSDFISIPSPKAVPPPSPMYSNMEPRQSASSETLQTPSPTNSDSGVDSNVASVVGNVLVADTVPTVSISNTEDVFKKPFTPPSKQRGRKKKHRDISEAGTSDQSNTASHVTHNSMETTDTSNSSDTLRRSKRVPKQSAPPLFQVLFQKVLTQNLKKKEIKSKNRSYVGKKPEVKQNKKELAENIPDNNTINYSNAKTSKTMSKTMGKTISLQSNVKPSENDLECSHIKIPHPPDVDHFNNIFDQLRNTSGEMASKGENVQPNKQSNKVKKLRVRVAKTKHSSLEKTNTIGGSTPSVSQRTDVSQVDINRCETPSESGSVSSSTDTNSSNFELISWLKNITETESVERRDEIFKEMRISSASSLCFTELQGIEYAFYDTDDKASLGYLRFKPRQKKPRKRAKQFHLHFITLVGNFRITANDKERQVGTGDMVAIEKSVYYDIENLSDDIGILMVVKK